jgi:hypothetical protein
MRETTGQLRPVVESYLRGGMLDRTQLRIMRAYLRQWIESPAWDKNPHKTEDVRKYLTELRAGVSDIDSMERLEQWLISAVAAGIDPL